MDKKESRIKASRSLVKHFREKPWPQEVLFMTILKSLGVKFVFQQIVDVYIIDFFIPSVGLYIEVDSSNWCQKKKERAKVKDDYFKSNNLTLVRIKKDKVDRDAVLNILNTHNVITHP